MKKKCLDCGQLVMGRSDKKYCSDQCRNSHHNKRGRRINNLIRRINRRLSCNRRILYDLNPLGKHTVTREMLESKGFDFGLFTEISAGDANREYYFCYDQGYCFLSSHKVLLVDRSRLEFSKDISKLRAVYN
jgi:hypothetical protein